MRRTILALIFALAGWGCTTAPKTAEILSPQFAADPPRQIALAPVYFADEPIDRYFGTRAAEEIRWHAARHLRSKGYEVELLPEPDSMNVPQVPSGSDMARLAPSVPSGAGAVMVIRVDHFLDAGLYGREFLNSLDVYATAALVGPGGEILWQDEGLGRGPALATSIAHMDAYQTSAFLAESLFDTLPSAGGR